MTSGNEQRLKDRVVMVTGAGRGLGHAVAVACAREGATVALVGRKPEKLAASYDVIVDAGGPEPVAIPVDLATATDADYNNLAQMVRREVGRLDGLVHCAVHFSALQPLRDQTLEQWTTHLRVNLAAPFALTRACLKLLAASDHGNVIFTSETHALAPAAYWGAFAVSKSGLSTLATIWNDECETQGRPRFHVLVPGPVATPQRMQSHPAENHAALPSAESVAQRYVRLLAG